MKIQNLEREIQEKRRQMSVLEQRIVESGEASMSSASLIDMQQVCFFYFVFLKKKFDFSCSVSILYP